jgi:methylenetetrahydrofolate dehydrogenase (NADP+) / methenyltetrahydrofolate cyclohydrolase
MTMLSHYDIDVRGKHVVVLGRSNIVGKPMALMLMNAGATVTSCNSATQNLEEITKKADIVIVAIGKPGFLKKEMVSEKSIIIDVGSTFVDGVGR